MSLNMISVTEAILNRKQTYLDILSNPEEQLRLFNNQAFGGYLSAINMTILVLPSTFKGRKQEPLVITMDPNTLASVKNQRSF